MRGLSRQNVEKKMKNKMFIHSKTFKNDGFRSIILGIKKYILGRYTLAKLPTSLFSTKGDAEHICDLDHPNCCFRDRAAEELDAGATIVN